MVSLSVGAYIRQGMKNRLLHQVHGLVNSMTTAEKTYFKKSLSKRDSVKLGKVFDIINTKGAYDESVLEAKLTEVYSDVRDALRQLLQRLLHTISIHHRNRSVTTQLNVILTQVEVLIDKRQLQLAKKLLDQGIALARENDLHAYSHILLTHKRMLPKDVRGKSYEALQEIDTLRIKEVESLMAESRLGELIDTVNRYGKRDLPSMRNRVEFFEKVLNSDIISEWHLTEVRPHLLLSGMSTIDGAYFFYGNWERAREGALEILKRLGDVKLLGSQEHRIWVLNQNNVMLISNMLLDRARFQKARQELLNSLKLRNESAESIRHANLAQHEIANMLLEGRHDEAISKLESMLNGLLAYESQISDGHNALRLGIAQSLWMRGSYSECLKYVSLHLNDISSGMQTIVLFTRWLDVLCAYDLGDSGLFSSRLRALKHFLKKADTGFYWEEEILATISSTFGQKPTARRSAFNALMKTLADHQQELRYYFGEFDAFHWLKSKTTNMQFGEYVTKEYMKG